MAVTMKNVVSSDVGPFRSCMNRRLGGTYRLHLQGRKINERGTNVSMWLQTALFTCLPSIASRLLLKCHFALSSWAAFLHSCSLRWNSNYNIYYQFQVNKVIISFCILCTACCYEILWLLYFAPGRDWRPLEYMQWHYSRCFFFSFT
jgi:hypothetical protein